MNMRIQLFIIIFQLLTIINTSFAIKRNGNLIEVWNIYNTTYDQRQLQQDPFCAADLMMKTAVCNALFSDQSFQMSYSIYLNKSAIFHNWISCENNNVITDGETKTEFMFPCYGRHDPVWSGWGVDDHYKFIYVSGGLDRDSVFIYHRVRTLDNDKYHLWEIIEEIGLFRLQPITITRGEARADLLSLQLLTITNNSKIMEINYIRNMIKKEYKYASSFPICNLSKEKKLAACKIVVQQIKNIESNFSFKLLEHMFGLLPVRCTDENIEFDHYKLNEAVKIKMFTCYGRFKDETNVTRLKLSNGYYENAILAFIIRGSSNYHNFLASVYNIKIPDLQPAYIPPPPPSLPDSHSV